MTLRLVVAVGLLVVAGTVAIAYRHLRSGGADVASLPPLPAGIAGGNATWVVFTTKLCATCEPVKERITRLDPTADLVEVDVATRPDLARAFGVRTAPTVLFAGANGRIRARFVGNVPESELATARA